MPGTANNGNPQYKLMPFNDASGLCSATFVCTWDPNEAGSWKTNMNEDVTKAFTGTTATSTTGSASRRSASPRRPASSSAAGGDPVLLNALDGADTDNGCPDGNHIDNANMTTPPDGTPPTMQMYLWHFPGTTDERGALPADVSRRDRRRASCTTSTPTVCPTGSSSTPTATRR